MGLFNIKTDQLDDKDEDQVISVETSDSELNEKVNYIIRKLSACGWFIVAKNAERNNVEFIYIPAYSIQLLKILDELTSDIGSYLPLVHQTYAELSMEDEKEDDYMYRSLVNARNNADAIEMAVTLLKQQICVFGNRLTTVLDPNVALKQHFDEYRVLIADRYYHPMKTFDALGLYSQPTITILNRWLKSERIMTILIKEARKEAINSKKSEEELITHIMKMIQDIIDIFSRLTAEFKQIDAANAKYTQAVEKKVNYLASSDKTTKGKIDKIILAMATEIQGNPALKYEEMPIINKATDTLLLNRQGYLDSGSLTMPFKRAQAEESEFLPIDDTFDFEEQSAMMNQFLDRDVIRFSDDTIIKFIEANLKGRDQMDTTDVDLSTLDNLVMWILAIIKAMHGSIPYVAEKIADQVEYENFLLPLYRFTKKKEHGKNVSRRV